MKGIQNNIARIRKEKGYTQESLSETLEIDRTHLSKVECGKTNPSMMLLSRLAEKLNVSIKDFF